MPPASRNHLVPTACGTPVPIAASSLDKPAAIPAQNRRCSSPPATGGRLGDTNGARPDRAERGLRSVIAISCIRVLRRPSESTQYASADYRFVLERHGITQSMSRRGNCLDNAPMESFFASLKKEHVHQACFRTREEAKAAVFDYIEVFYNRQRLHSGVGYRTPAEARVNMMREVAMAIAA